MKKNVTKKPQQIQIDYPLLMGVIVIVAIGLVMIYSSSFYNNIVSRFDHVKPESFFGSSLSFAGIGLFLMVLLSYVNYHYLRKFTWILALCAITLSLIAILKGNDINGATRWIRVFGVSFMPSELTKVALIFVLADLLTRMGEGIKKLRGVLLTLGLIGIMGYMTIMQNDFSTTVLIVTVGISMMLIAGMKFLYLFVTLALGGALSWTAVLMKPYRMERIQTYMDSFFDRVYLFEDGKRQIHYSIYALGNGGLFGVGLGKSEIKSLRLPEPYNDFIFAIIGEEFGFLGTVVILALFAFVIYRIFHIAMSTKDFFGYFLAIGTGFLLSYQVIINVGVVTNLLPTTGIPLPFVSKGGSSLVIMMALMGVMLNISYRNQLEEVKR